MRRARMWSNCVSKRVGMVFQKPESLPACPFTTMWLLARAPTGIRRPREAGRHRGKESLRDARSGTSSRTASSRTRWASRRTAAAAVHRARARCRARKCYLDGRALTSALDPISTLENRGSCNQRAEGKVYYCHRHAQHAAGRAHLRLDRVFPARAISLSSRRRRNCSRSPPTSAPRITSPGGLDNGQPAGRTDWTSSTGNSSIWAR